MHAQYQRIKIRRNSKIAEYFARVEHRGSFCAVALFSFARNIQIGTVGVTGYVNVPSLYIDVNNTGVTQTQEMTHQNTLDPCLFW